jgi:acetyl-CoA acyltransferase
MLHGKTAVPPAGYARFDMHHIPERGWHKKIAACLHQRYAGDFVTLQHFRLRNPQRSLKQRIRAAIKIFKIARKKYNSERVAVAPFNLNFFSIRQHRLSLHRHIKVALPEFILDPPNPIPDLVLQRVFTVDLDEEQFHPMTTAFICDAIRTPIGRYGGALASVRADDLAAIPIKALLERSPNVDWNTLDDVIYGCANQAGEDNRNVARMALLLAGLPKEISGTTVNRLCGSSMDAVAIASRAVKSGEVDLLIAGGVESMTRAPFVVGKADSPFSRSMKLEDTTIGWRFVNPSLKDLMPQTAEIIAEEFNVSRTDQDAFALRSQQRTAVAVKAGRLGKEITSVTIPQKKGDPLLVNVDEHPRPDTTFEGLAKLKGVVKPEGTVTAGNSSGINDGACALLIASEEAVRRYGLTPKARVIAAATAGVAPRIMGMGPVPATKKVLAKTNLTISQMDVIELNEAFASQGLAVLRELGVPDDAAHVNPNGGAIAIGHPLGASGARLVTTATYQLQCTKGRYALCTMCIGVGQGISIIIERV